VRWPRGRTWSPKIRQRQWLHKQHLYGYRDGPPEPEHDVSEADQVEDEAAESRQADEEGCED
jgi:hypothetical protein